MVHVTHEGPHEERKTESLCSIQTRTCSGRAKGYETSRPASPIAGVPGRRGSSRTWGSAAAGGTRCVQSKHSAIFIAGQRKKTECVYLLIFWQIVIISRVIWCFDNLKETISLHRQFVHMGICMVGIVNVFMVCLI